MMFEIFRKSKPVGLEQDAQFNRYLFDQYSQTQTQTKAIFEDRNLFTLLAAALFALQQDALVALSIDLRKTDDMVHAIATDKLRPDPLGSFPERFGLAIDSLRTINDTNLQFLEIQKPDHIGNEDFKGLRVMASLRSVSARIWLLTLMSKTPVSLNLKIGVAAILMLFESVKADELVEDARAFSGTFFNDARAGTFNLLHWPPIALLK